MRNHAEDMRRYRAKHRARLLLKRRLDYKLNAEREAQRMREYRAKHKERLHEKTLLKYKADPERYRAYSRKHYAKHHKRPRILLTKKQLRENDKQRSLRWRTKNLEYKRAADRKYAANNREKANQRAHKWYKENTERAAAGAKRYRENNPDLVLSYARNAKARRKGADGHHTIDEANAIRKLQKNKCAYCKTPLKREAHLDHIIPIALGGSNWPSNLQWLCQRCNLCKNAKHPVDYANSIGLLV